MRYAAIDIGTNSTRLLVAEKKGGNFFPVVQELATTRLGRDLVHTGLLCPQGEKATLAAVSAFVRRAREAGAESIRIVGTSALREAGNGRDFAQKVARLTGLAVEVLPPLEEAKTSYLGATGRLGNVPDDTVVFDLGGGSCELCKQEAGGFTFCSLAMGAVYLTDMFFAPAGVNEQQAEAASRYIRHLLSGFPSRCEGLIGIGGTVTTLAAIDLGLEQYDPEKVHGHVLAAEKVASIFGKLVERAGDGRGALPGLPPDRAEIMPAGTLAVLEMLRYFSRDSLVVSEGGLLWGMLISRA